MKTATLCFPFAQCKQKKQTTFSARFKKAVKARSFKQLGNLANDVAKVYFAPFAVMDLDGTCFYCWTMEDAQDWLRFMGGSAYICDTYDYLVIECRKQ